MLQLKQALTKAYSLYDFGGQWGLVTKVNLILQKCSMYPVLTWSEFRADMHQAFMVNGHYTKYE